MRRFCKTIRNKYKRLQNVFLSGKQSRFPTKPTTMEASVVLGISLSIIVLTTSLWDPDNGARPRMISKPLLYCFDSEIVHNAAQILYSAVTKSYSYPSDNYRLICPKYSKCKTCFGDPRMIQILFFGKVLQSTVGKAPSFSCWYFDQNQDS